MVKTCSNSRQLSQIAVRVSQDGFDGTDSSVSI